MSSSADELRRLRSALETAQAEVARLKRTTAGKADARARHLERSIEEHEAVSEARLEEHRKRERLLRDEVDRLRTELTVERRLTRRLTEENWRRSNAAEALPRVEKALAERTKDLEDALAALWRAKNALHRRTGR